MVDFKFLYKNGRLTYINNYNQIGENPIFSEPLSFHYDVTPGLAHFEIDLHYQEYHINVRHSPWNKEKNKDLDLMFYEVYVEYGVVMTYIFYKSRKYDSSAYDGRRDFVYENKLHLFIRGGHLMDKLKGCTCFCCDFFDADAYIEKHQIQYDKYYLIKFRDSYNCEFTPHRTTIYDILRRMYAGWWGFGDYKGDELLDVVLKSM